MRLCRPLYSRRSSLSLLVSGMVLFPLIVQADDTTRDKGTVWGLGAGVTSSQQPYVDMDRDTSVLPLLHIENKYLKFFGTALEAKLPTLTLSETNSLHFGLIGRWDGSGYEPDDSWMLEGMEKRKGGFQAGGKAEWQTSLVNISVDWTHDLSGNSKGQCFDLVLDRSWHINDHLTLTPRIGASWHDSKYVDYYYGVRPTEARDGRPEYRGESGVSAEAGLQSVYRFNDHHSLILDAQVRSLSSEVKESPLVDGSTSNRLSLGYIYYF